MQHDLARSIDLIAGRYRLGPELGHGGMSDVFEGHDDRLDRPVAVKLLRVSAVSGDEGRRRFAEEAKAAARLTHPNVVTVFDYGEHEGRPFIVMERLPGRTLDDEIAEAPVPVDAAVTWVGQVLEALALAHEAGIVHRDVKPGNVMLASDGRAMVADFGIAKSVEAAAQTAGSGGLLGTPAYLAPERVAGEPATIATDLYAVGVVLYELLAGRRPFEGDTAMAVMRAIDDGKVEPLRSLRPEVTPDLDAVVERSMARSPSRRFPSAEAMRAALQAASPAASPAGGPMGQDDEAAAADVAVTETQVLAPPVIRPQGPATERIERPAPSPVQPASRTATGAKEGPSRRRSMMGVVIVAVVAALVLIAALLAMLGSGDGGPGFGGDGLSETTTTITSTSVAGATPAPSLPAGLDDALDALDEAVQP